MYYFETEKTQREIMDTKDMHFENDHMTQDQMAEIDLDKYGLPKTFDDIYYIDQRVYFE